LVKICCRSDNPLLLDIAKEIAMQVAAANPLFLDRGDIDKDKLEEIRQKFIEEAHSKTNETKIVEKIVIGKLNKYYKDNCLLEQPWIKDEDINISTYLNKSSMEIGTDIKVADFIRFERSEDAGK
jgi:elongation factor Ts